jgi:hypothetical protein
MPDDFKQGFMGKNAWVRKMAKERRELPRFNGNFVTEIQIHFMNPEGEIKKYFHPIGKAHPFDLLELAWAFKKAEQIYGIDVELDEEVRELVDDID